VSPDSDAPVSTLVAVGPADVGLIVAAVVSPELPVPVASALPAVVVGPLVGPPDVADPADVSAVVSAALGEPDPPSSALVDPPGPHASGASPSAARIPRRNEASRASSRRCMPITTSRPAAAAQASIRDVDQNAAWSCSRT
jgi:hypothetical protein